MNSEKTDNTETVESIIQEFNKQNADRIKDAAGQKIFQVNKKTGKVSSKFISLLSDSFFPNLQNSVFLPEAISSQIPDGYYIISNSNFVHRATHVSDTISVQDKNGRKIDLSIRCEISCAPGNEEKVAKALLSSGNRPAYNLNLFLKKCVYRFQDDIEVFISNFYDSNLPGQIEKFIMEQKDPSAMSAHITGLTFHSVKCLQINKPEEVISINIEAVKVGFRDSVKEHSITLKCNLEISKTSNNAAHWRNISKEEFESIIAENVKIIYYRSISESDSFNKSDHIENTLKKYLNESLRIYNREITNLKLQDLYVETVNSKSSFEINPERKNYLTADREKIGLKVPLFVKITDLWELESYKKDTHLLKEKLTECADSAITNFIVNINFVEFYNKIEADFSFRKSFVDEIRQKINNLIDAEVTVRNVDYEDISDPDDKTWTSFEAVISKDMREFVITGSFSVIKTDLSNILIKKGRVFTVEDVKKKIIETLEASLIKRYLESSEEFEKVAHDLLAETVSEAYGVLIKTQNIKAELTGLSFEDEAINAEIRKWKLRKIEIIANTGDYEKVRKIDERILMLEEYKEKLTRNSGSQIIHSRHSYNLPDSKKSSLAGKSFDKNPTDEGT
jgi:ribosomal protein S18